MRAIAHIIARRSRSAMKTIPGSSRLLGHLPEWRNDRAATLIRIAGEHDIVRLRMGFFTITFLGAPALAHELLTTRSDAFVKSPGLSIFLRPVLGNGLLTSEHDF